MVILRRSPTRSNLVTSYRPGAYKHSTTAVTGSHMLFIYIYMFVPSEIRVTRPRPDVPASIDFIWPDHDDHYP
jgi:hypothetical protein